MKTYKNIVDDFQTACNEHLAINFFSSGTIDKLDSTSQNVTYPMGFLRPLTSIGAVLNNLGTSGERTLTFELYMLDVPKLTDSDVTKLMSNCEIYIYDIISWFNLGSMQQDYEINLNNITPAEAWNSSQFKAARLAFLENKKREIHNG